MVLTKSFLISGVTFTLIFNSDNVVTCHEIKFLFYHHMILCIEGYFIFLSCKA